MFGSSRFQLFIQKVINNIKSRYLITLFFLLGWEHFFILLFFYFVIGFKPFCLVEMESSQITSRAFCGVKSNYAALIQTTLRPSCFCLGLRLIQLLRMSLRSGGKAQDRTSAPAACAALWQVRRRPGLSPTDNLCAHELLSQPSEAPSQAKTATICWLQLAFYLHTVGQLMEYYAE